MVPRVLLSVGFAIAFGTFAAPGRAHINLQSPRVRAPGFPDTYLRREPCGQIADARDPERVSTFEPGQTIVVEWEVYQQHVSYFRVAVDLDGDDSFSGRTSQPTDAATDDLSQLPPNPGERILAYVEDDAGRVDHVAQPVTLPNEECERCTLQVIQFTYGLPLYQATYYQCADIVLRRSAQTEAPASSDAGAASPDPGEGADGETRAEASGCVLSPPRPDAGPAWGALGMLGLALGAHARRHARGAGRGGAPQRALTQP